MPPMELDRTDIAILRALQADGRQSNLALAEKVNLSPSPCLRRVRQLEEAGVIRGYTALVDPKAYGLPLTLYVRISLERHARDVVETFEQAIEKLEEVVECHLLTGGADYLLRVVVADLEDYQRFMSEEIHVIPGVASIDTSFALKTVKSSRVYKKP
ncbi:Lrp/AsnC family transcriptional regulator [Sphingomicrobium sp. B8]|uniref:Lrp/AsnC family transcriptional regulator n=2 Tax=Sphingomicrobium clamense TaxID=2851013 RepID=A0ABS6V7D0_9SPHN|nr:Lrp/AsnC family transcriptional regulator [Sphingomicrobium sp. B8]